MKNFFMLSITVFSLVVMIFVSNVSNANSVSVSVWADSDSVIYGGSTTIHWSSTGASKCSGGDTALTSGDFSTGALTSSKTFTIKCDDGMVYYQLSPCHSNNNGSYEIGPVSEGSYSSGDMVAGSVEWDGFYDYKISGSSDNPTGRQIIGVSSISTSNSCN